MSTSDVGSIIMPFSRKNEISNPTSLAGKYLENLGRLVTSTISASNSSQSTMSILSLDNKSTSEANRFPIKKEIQQLVSTTTLFLCMVTNVTFCPYCFNFFQDIFF